MSTAELRKIFNTVLSNYERCTEQMKLVVNSITLSLNNITQTDGHHVEYSDIFIGKKLTDKEICLQSNH